MSLFDMAIRGQGGNFPGKNIWCVGVPRKVAFHSYFPRGRLHWEPFLTRE